MGQGGGEECDICGSSIHTTDEHLEDAFSDAEQERILREVDEVEDAIAQQADERLDPQPHTDGEANEFAIGAAERSPGDSRPHTKRFGNPKNLPEVRIGPKLADNIDEACKALRSDEDVFVQSYKLAHVTRVTREDATASALVREASEYADERRELVEGTPMIHRMEPATLTERLTRVAVFTRLHRKSIIETLPTQPLVYGLFHRKAWPGLRPIVGIAEAPFMRPDGTICQAAGYDPATGYLYAPSDAFPTIGEKPAQCDAVEARKLLESIYVDFPWVPKEHAAVPLAAILTILARPAIAGSVPAILFTANTPGTGKSLTTDTVALVVSGRHMPRSNYPAHHEEQAKVLGAYALRGATFLSLDNIAFPFGGPALDLYITATATVEARVLGKSEMPTVPWRGVIFGTGNNIEVIGDMATRILLACLETDLEDPRRRTGFKHQRLLTWVRGNRARFVAAALTILRGYVAAGRPNMGCETWGSFEGWSRLIPHALVWAGAADPMSACIRDAASVNDELRHFVVVLKGLAMLGRTFAKGKPGLSAKDIIHILYEERPHDTLMDELRGSLEALCNPRQQRGESKPTHQALGYKLRAFKGRPIGGKRLRTVPDRNGVGVWFVDDLQRPDLRVVDGGVVEAPSGIIRKAVRPPEAPHSTPKGETRKKDPPQATPQKRREN